MCHCAILASHSLDYTTAVVPYICPAQIHNLRLLAISTLQFYVGAILLVVGGVVRLWCYHALGPFFTFEVGVKEDHILVTTGPYSFVRHPSYTAITALILGAQLVHFGRGSFVGECGIEDSPMLVLVRIWQWGSLFGLLSLYRRCSIEDAQLKAHFRDTWMMYSDHVSYRLVPFVY